MESTILHLDLDTFFVSVERLHDSRLIGKPVLIGGVTDRGVVASCSYEARIYGVHSAMPMKRAKELCPEAIQIRGNTASYTEYSEEVTEIIKEAVPLYEKTSIDEFYADLTGMDRFFNSYLLATELRKRVKDKTGLPISFGLSKNKTVSKIATGEAKPNSQMKVDFGTEKKFMAPLSISKIPMVGEVTQHTLYNLGVKHIKTIQEMPMELMERVLGKNGVSIWKKAQGLDVSPVVPYNERKSISTERTFDRDTIDVIKLKGVLLAMAENLAFQLRRGGKLTACVTVKIRYSDFNTYTLQSRIPYTSADHTLIKKVFELFEKLYNKRLLVRLIGIKYSHLVGGSHQINLFEDVEEQLSLYQAMDKIRDKHGDRMIMRAAGMDVKTINLFNPFTGEAPSLLNKRK